MAALSLLFLSSDCRAEEPFLGGASAPGVEFLEFASSPFGEFFLARTPEGRALVASLDRSILDLRLATRPALDMDRVRELMWPSPDREQLLQRLRSKSSLGRSEPAPRSSFLKGASGLGGGLMALAAEFRHFLRTSPLEGERLVEDFLEIRPMGGRESVLSESCLEALALPGPKAGRERKKALTARLAEGPLAGFQAGGGDLAGIVAQDFQLISPDLRFANADGAVLARGSISGGARMEWMRLRGAVLNDLEISGAQLRGANLYGTRLSKVRLAGSDLREADLRRTRFAPDCDLTDVLLEGAVFDSHTVLPFDRGTAEARGMVMVD